MTEVIAHLYIASQHWCPAAPGTGLAAGKSALMGRWFEDVAASPHEGGEVAIYHFSGQIIGRKAKQNPDGSWRPGSKAAAAAAYRSGSQLRDARTGELHDYSRRGGVAHSEIMLPPGAAAWLEDRELLWGTVERMEKREDAQLAREFNMALPHELDAAQRLELVRGFVQRNFVNKGMVADIALHDPMPERGQNAKNFHAHVMLTLRKATPEGLHPVKTREWNGRELLALWRSEWALACNQALERAGQRVRVDHRTLVAQRDEAQRQRDLVRSQELNRQAEIHVGPRAWQMARHKWRQESRARWVGAMRRANATAAAERRLRDYPARDKGTRLNWLESIIVGNNERLRRDLEATNRRFDRYERKLDYWQRRTAFLLENKLSSKKTRFERWQAAERRKQEEAARLARVEHARRRQQQLRDMMQQLRELDRVMKVQRERGLIRAREVEKWLRDASRRVRSRIPGRARGATNSTAQS